MRQALPPFLDEMVRIGEIRRSTAKGYRNRLAVWAYPAIGDVAWNELTREQIGAVLIKLRAAGRSLACLEQIRCPLTRFYQWQINARGYKGPNPAADLKFFLGRQPSQRSRKRDLQWFRQDEARRLLSACRALKPRVVSLSASVIRRRTPVGGDDGTPAIGPRLAPRAPARAADVVRERRPSRALQGRRGSLGNTACLGHGEGGIETPLRGNGPFTGYGYFLYTRPHFLHENLYLRLIIPPGYFISELIRDHWPVKNSALGIGVSGGLWADSHEEFRDGRYEEDESFFGHSVGGTFAYYLRGPKIAGRLPLEGQIRANPKYVWYDRTDDTSRDFRLPDNTAIYDVRVGVRLGGVPPELFPKAALELSVWHTVSYRDEAGRYGFADQPQASKHLTQRTWTRVGGIHTFWGTEASAFLNAGIAEDVDALSAFRLGGGLRLRAEFPLLLHGYSVEEIFAERFWLLNLAYRFPIWPGQDRVHLQLLADYAGVSYVKGHDLPRSGLAGVGANLSLALTRRITLVVGYGYGIDAPRGSGFGGHEFDTQFEFKY